MKNASDLRELNKIKESVVNGCMKCGSCSFYCPVYLETLDEGNVARGKISLIRELLAGNIELNADLLERLETCLLCGNCVTNCPTHVGSDRIIMAARADYARNRKLPLAERVLFRQILSRRVLFGQLAKLASKFQAHIPRLQKTGVIRHLPDALRGMASGGVLPTVSKRFLREQLPEVSKPPAGVKTIAVVGFFSGCGLEFIYPQDGMDVVGVLNQLGVEVHYPKAQSCCGMPVFSRGDLEASRKLVNRNVVAFKDFDVVLTACATCGSALKNLNVHLGEVAEKRPDIQSLSHKVMDLNEYLMALIADRGSDFKAKRVYEGKTVTWHDPCHLVRHQGIRSQPRDLLKAISNIRYVEMPGADLCCGMGGAFGLKHPDISEKIVQKKIEGIRASGADIVVTACPGCLVQLNHALNINNLPQKAVHIMNLFRQK